MKSIVHIVPKMPLAFRMPTRAAALWRFLLVPIFFSVSPQPIRAAQATLVYSNCFNDVAGTTYTQWASSIITYASDSNPPRSGTLPPPIVASIQSPNGRQTFLGEFGGPPIGTPNDAGWNKTRVDQTITLALTNLPAHTELQLSFDVYILKSWDGNSPAFGPDRFVLSVNGGPVLLDTTFSNNPKTGTDGSFQNYPAIDSPPRTGAFSTNTLGYNRFFCDSIYRFQYHFTHTGSAVTLNFRSSLFEGKGTTDESWGLDNVVVTTMINEPAITQQPAFPVNYLTEAAVTGPEPASDNGQLYGIF